MPGWKLGAPLLLFFVAFGIDGSNSYLYLIKQTAGGALDNIPNLYIPNNTLRLLTGSGMGIALASIIYPAFNQTAWRESDPQRALDWKKLGILIGTILLIDLLILTEHPAILYPIAGPQRAGCAELANSCLQHGLGTDDETGKCLRPTNTDVDAHRRRDDSRLFDDHRHRLIALQTDWNLGSVSPGLILALALRRCAVRQCAEHR